MGERVNEETRNLKKMRFFFKYRHKMGVKHEKQDFLICIKLLNMFLFSGRVSLYFSLNHTNVYNRPDGQTSQKRETIL